MLSNHRSSSTNTSLCIAFITLLNVPVVVAETLMLDPVLVTATKQDFELSKTDSAVLVKSGEELEQAGITQVKDLEKVFAGLMIQTRGNRTYASTSVRGMNSPDFYSPTINVLVDGVKQDSAFITQPLLNVERVEFMRGPQGTLYGSNAQGGIINIITRKGEDGVTLSASISNLNQQVKGHAVLSISDDFYIDVSARADKELGFIEHQPTGESDANDVTSTTGVVKVNYQPDLGPWDATLSLGTDKLESHEEWYLTEAEFDNKSTAQDIPELERYIQNYGLNANYETARGKLTSISSLQDRQVDRLYVGGQWHEDQQTTSQELRLQTSHSDRLSTLVGIYLEKQNFDGEAFGATNKIIINTKALFGQVRYAMNESVDLTLGTRVAQVSSESDYSGNAAFAIAGYKDDRSDKLTSPKVSIGWQLNSDSRLYASVASGYRPGGFNRVPFGNGSAGYNNEESLSVELGWHTSLLNNTLNFTGAIYQIDTDNVQLYVGNIPNQVLTNLGKATSSGVEFDIAWKTTSALTLNLGGTFGKSEFGNGNNELKGNRLTYAPDTTLVFGAEFLLPKYDILLKANARHNSKVYYNELNTVSQSAITLADVAAEYANGDMTYRLFFNNVTDKEYVSYAYQGMTGIASNYGKGREVGVGLSMQW